MNRSITIASAAALAFSFAACSQPASQGDMSAHDSAVPAVTGPIRGTGAVVAIDPAAGTVTLKHEPIEAIQWGAMTMEFKAADPAVLQGVAAGDRVAFELKSAAEPQTVTMVQKQ